MSSNGEIARELGGERRDLERWLRRCEAQLALQSSIARIGSWSLELAGNALWWCETTFVLHEVEHRRQPTIEEAIAFYHPEDRPRLAAAVERALAGGGDYDGEFRIVTARGRERWVRTMGRLIAEAGRPVRLSGVFQDIDAHKRAELALAEAEARWRFALDGAGHGVWDWRVDTGEIYFSPQGKALLGYAGEELAGTIDAWKERAHPDDLPAAEAALLAHFAGRSDLYACEHRMRCKDGSWKWILARGRVIEWHAPGQPRRMIGTHTDIDELRRVQTELRTSETRFRQLFDFAPDSIFLVSADPADRGLILDANEPAACQHGYTRAELRGMRITDLDDAQSALEAPERIRRILTEGVFSFEVRHRRKDGSMFPVEVTAAVVEAGGRRLIQSFNRDITVRKETQARERELLERLGLALKAADLGVFRRNLRTDAGEWDARTWAIYGRSPRAAAPTSAEIVSFVHEEDRVAYLRAREATLAPGTGGSRRARYRIRRADGAVRHVETQAIVVNGADGRPEWLIGTAQDQTDALRQVEALAASERLRQAANLRLRLALAATGIGTWRHNFLTGEAEWDENTLRLFGFERMPGYEAFLACVVPEDRPWVEKNWAALAAGQRTFQGQFRARRSDGSVVHVQTQGLLETDAQGRAEWVTGVNLDVTPRSRTEA
jgi:PAS domain S-box-containing protein